MQVKETKRLDVPTSAGQSRACPAGYNLNSATLYIRARKRGESFQVKDSPHADFSKTCYGLTVIVLYFVLFVSLNSDTALFASAFAMM